MLLLVNGGLSKAGVGTWRMGSGGASWFRASVTPGMLGIRGGNEMERHCPREARGSR